MSRKTPIAVLVMALCLMVLPASAAPLQKSEISPAANWVAHFDLEVFRTSNIGKLVLAELRNNQEIEQKIQSFAILFSFNPLQDIRDVTLYGNGRDREKAVIIVEGQFDTQKLISLLRLDSKYQEIPYKDTMVYRWKQDPKHREQSSGDQAAKQPAEQMMYGCVCDGDRVVMGAGLETVKQAVDTLKGQSKAASTGLPSQIPQAQDTVFVQIAATGVGDILGQSSQAAMLKQTGSLALTVGESEGRLIGQVSLQAPSAEVADNTAKLLEGLIAMVQLSAGEQPQLAELARNFTVTPRDKTTQVRFEAPAENVFQFLKTQWEQKQKQSQQQSAPTP